MSSDSKTINNATDAYITARRPKLSRPNTSKLILDHGGSGDQRRAFLFFTLPFAFGSTIDQGLFRLTQAHDFTGGSVSITVNLVTAQWKVGKLNWDNQPATSPTNAVTLTKTNPTINTVWEWDLKAMLQGVSFSQIWWGIRVASSSDTPIYFFSAQGLSTGKPELALSWSDLPMPPDNPSPSGGRAVSVQKPILTVSFEDDSGNTEINAMRVQYSATGADFDSQTGFASPSWDSGTYFTSVPQMDTSTIAGAPAIATDVPNWWTASVQDGNGVWSEFMDPESFTYHAASTATLDSPPDATPSQVTDATPLVLWTMPNQTAYKIVVYDPLDPATILWNSGKVSTTENGAAIAPKVLTQFNFDYAVDVYLWDDQNREKNGANDIYIRLHRVFQLVSTSTVAPVTNVVATQQNPWPWVNVTFDRSTPADEYNILRDGKVVEANISPTETSTGGTHNLYQDRLASPRQSHVWTVQAVVNKVASNGVDSNPVSTRLLAPFMMELDSSNPVYFLNPAVDPSQLSIQEVQQPVNAAPVLLTQYIADKFQGHLEGTFADDIMPGVSARDMRDRFKKWKRNPGDTYILYLVDEVMTICPYNMTYKPRAISGGVLYDVALDFFEE